MGICRIYSSITIVYFVIRMIAGKLHIVSSISHDRIGLKSVASMTRIWEIYCQHHNYSFTMLTIPEYHGFQTFFAARWHYLLHLMRSNDPGAWFLAIDSDTVIANMNRTFESYLNGTYQMYFQFRENHEVIAGMMLMKNTRWVHGFIANWLTKSYFPEHMLNADNGDLLLSLLQAFVPQLARRCASMRLSYGPYVTCFEKALPDMLHEIQTKKIPVSFWYPHEGMWRSHESNNHPMAPSILDKIFSFCWSNDFMIHGWKQIHLMWNRKNEFNRIVAPGCKFRSDEVATATRCCFWKFPGCIENGVNLCKTECLKRCTSTGCVLGLGQCHG